MTPAQQRILDAARAGRTQPYNGRARRSIAALEAAGLVEADWDMYSVTSGNGVQLHWRITVRPKGDPR